MVRLVNVLLFFLLMCRCVQLAGTSTETTNGFTVSIVETTLTGTGLQGTKIGVYPVEYNPADTVKTEPDTVTVFDSTFNLSGIQPGHYNILIQKVSDNSGYCIQNVLFNSGAIKHYSGILEQTGSLHGKLANEIPADSLILAYLVGTPFLDTIRTDQQFLINKVPAGGYTLFFQKISTGDHVMLGTQAPTVKINSGMLTEWKQ